MRIDIQSIDHSVENEVLTFIHKSIAKNERKYNWIESARIVLKEENHDQDKDYVAEVRLAVPGPDLFCDGRDFTMQLAVKKAMDRMTRLLMDKKKKDFGHPTEAPAIM